MNKQKLQEQIDTMREELAKMETELAESEKVELKNGRYYFDSCNVIHPSDNHSNTVVQNGFVRQTKELAEIASKNMVTRNKLEACAHQIDPEWRDGGEGTPAYEIYDCSGIYFSNKLENTRSVGAVYMSKSTAEQICKWLNDGRIEL